MEALWNNFLLKIKIKNKKLDIVMALVLSKCK
jgi:hypothetical protein